MGCLIGRANRLQTGEDQAGRAAAQLKGKPMSEKTSATSPEKVAEIHEALIFAMVTIAAVDREISDNELQRIGRIVSNLPVFRDFNTDSLVQTAEACGNMLSGEDGLEKVLHKIGTAIPHRLRETTYALAVEIAAADLSVSQEEARFLELLADRLELDQLNTVAIERGARARHVVI
jgi:tellurite resistance protein